MDQLKNGFETALRVKLSQKSMASQGEETILLRNFKYFDSDNDGFISLNEWFKAVEKIGVVVPSLGDLEQLFCVYDLDGDGKIDYREFVNILYGRIKPGYIFGTKK